jgi:hypothetical protein
LAFVKIRWIVSRPANHSAAIEKRTASIRRESRRLRYFRMMTGRPISPPPHDHPPLLSLLCEPDMWPHLEKSATDLDRSRGFLGAAIPGESSDCAHLPAGEVKITTMEGSHAD